MIWSQSENVEKQSVSALAARIHVRTVRYYASINLRIAHTLDRLLLIYTSYYQCHLDWHRQVYKQLNISVSLRNSIESGHADTVVKAC